MAKFLGLPTSSSQPFSVLVGNGEGLHCSEMCPKVPLFLNNIRFDIDFFVLPIRGAEVVLGVQWLKLLCPIVTDYSTLSMTFNWNKQNVVLQGIHDLPPTQISFHQFRRLMSTTAIHSSFHLISEDQPQTQESAPIPAIIQSLINESSIIFFEPK